MSNKEKLNKSEGSTTPKIKFLVLLEWKGRLCKTLWWMKEGVLTDLRSREDASGSNRPVAHREQLLGFPTDLQTPTARQKTQSHFQK